MSRKGIQKSNSKVFFDWKPHEDNKNTKKIGKVSLVCIEIKPILVRGSNYIFTSKVTKLKVHFRRSHEDDKGESREPLEWDYPSPPSSLWCWGGWRRPSAAPDLCRFPPSWSQWLEHITQVPCRDQIRKYFSALLLSVLPACSAVVWAVKEFGSHSAGQGWRKVVQNMTGR